MNGYETRVVRCSFIFKLNYSLSTRSDIRSSTWKMEEPSDRPPPSLGTPPIEEDTILPHSPSRDEHSQFTSISLADSPVTFPPPSQTILSAPAIERSTSTQSSRSLNSSSTNLNATVYGVALVGFDHAYVLSTLDERYELIRRRSDTDWDQMSNSCFRMN